MASYEWEQFTIGQNQSIQDIVGAATKASELLNANMAFAKTGLQIASAFLMGVVNPKVLLLNAIADEIDKFTADFKGTGFHVIEITPTGKEVLPKDADGNPVKLVLGSAAVAANYAAVAALGDDGLIAEFIKWSKEFLGEDDPANLKKTSYLVSVGKSLPPAARTENANDDSASEKDPIFGMHKMTPSQIIAQIISAMDDELDDRRPQFSSSADVGALVIIIGFSDMTKNLPSLGGALETIVEFFGGENGLLTKGLQQIGTLVKAAAGQLEDPSKHNVVFKVEDITGVRGTITDKESLKPMGVEYNFKKMFEEGDFVVGPRAKFGARAMGYVSKVENATLMMVDEIIAAGTPFEKTIEVESEVYQTAEVTITGASELDHIAFTNIGAGASLQKVHYFQNRNTYVDQNSSEPVEGPLYNDYKYYEDLSMVPIAPPSAKSEADEGDTKVVREGGNALLTIKSKSTVLETHNVGGIDYKVKTSIIGTISEPKKKTAPPPNFKAAKLEDLIGDFKTFFSAIDTFSATLRGAAGDTSNALDGIIKFLEGKIKELDAINEALQKVLALFSVGLPQAGVYVLMIPDGTPGGNDAVKSALSSATNKPPDSLDFCVGMMMMGGSASIKPLMTLLAAGSGGKVETKDVTAGSVAEQLLR